jgi:hypothetical protein
MSLKPEIHAVVQAVFELDAGSGGSTLNSIYTLINKRNGTRKTDVERDVQTTIKLKLLYPTRRAFILSKKGRDYCLKIQRLAQKKADAERKLKKQKMKKVQDKRKAELKRQMDEAKAAKKLKENQIKAAKAAKAKSKAMAKAAKKAAIDAKKRKEMREKGKNGKNTSNSSSNYTEEVTKGGRGKKSKYTKINGYDDLERGLLSMKISVDGERFTKRPKPHCLLKDESSVFASSGLMPDFLRVGAFLQTFGPLLKYSKFDTKMLQDSLTFEGDPMPHLLQEVHYALLHQILLGASEEDADASEIALQSFFHC